MKIIPKLLLLSYTLAIIGCGGGPDAESGKVVVTATKALGRKDLVSTPRPKK
jgi:hypothetical protein